jgi:Flp pilus assembly protein TadG
MGGGAQRVVDMLAAGQARRRGQEGNAALEFALLAPLVLYLILGLITYGWILAFRQTLSQGAAEGARAAAVSPGGYTDTQKKNAAIAAINDSLTTYGLTCDTSGNLLKSGSIVGYCTVGVAICTNDSSNRCITVSLDYLYQDHPLIPLPGMGIAAPSHIPYTAVAEVNS